MAILIDGEPIPGEYHLLSLAVSRELNRIPRALLQLRDGEAARSTFSASNTDLFIPGKEIEIQLGYRAQNEPVFRGVIIKHGIRVRKQGSMLLVDCRDAAVKMTRGRKWRYFSEQKDSDIMETLIGSYGLQHAIAATEAELREVVQYEATDWDFLLCRAEANGLVVRVEDGKIIAERPTTEGEAVITVHYGATLLELDAEIDARRQSPGITARAWDATDQALLEAEAAEPTPTPNGNLSAATLAGVIGGSAHDIRHGGEMSLPELQAWADGRLLKERLARVRGRARFQGFAGILPGQLIELSGVGERFAGVVFVSGVRHTVAGGNWETDVELGLNPDLFTETFNLRPLPASGLLPAVSGLQLGIVTALENDPAGEHRIKVRLPLISTAEEGVWARQATLDAGNERGTFFRPEIGDEVVVGFLNDDPRYPTVLGMLHSSAKPPPETATDTNHRKGYVSREKLQFTFDDETKVIVLETPAGNRITLSEDNRSLLIEDQNSNKIRLDTDGILIDSPKEIILKAGKDIVLKASRNIECQAQAGFKAEGSATAELSGASTTLQGSAMTVVKGGIVQIN